MSLTTKRRARMHAPSKPGWLRSLIVVVALTLGMTVIPPASAGASSYTTYTCTSPNGQPGPVGGGGYGWASFATGSWAGYSNPWENNCSGGDLGQPQGLLSADTATLPRALNTGQGWEYKTPPGTRINSYQLWGSGFARSQLGNNTNSFVLVTSSNGFPGDWSTNAADYNSGQTNPAGAPWISTTGRDSDNIQIWAGTGGPADRDPSPAYGADFINSSVRVTKAVVTASDNASPVVGNVTGDASSDSTWHGNESLSFNASDTGAGIYRLIVKTGANSSSLTTRSQDIIDSNSGRCAAAPGTTNDQRIYSYAQPCPTSLAPTVAINSAELPEGRYFVRVSVEDAAGNATVAYEATKTVDNVAPTVAASVSGSTARVGDSLSCTVSVNGQSPTVSYAWERANADGSGGTTIGGATTATYVLAEADRGKKIRCKVTASDQGGAASATSGITDGPFGSGAVVADYCAGRPTGPRDDCGDLDRDGIPNYQDPDIDGDGTTNGADPDPYDASVPAKGGDNTPIDTGKTGRETTDPPGAGRTDDDQKKTDTAVVPPTNGTNASATVMLTASWAEGGRTSKTIAYSAGSNRRTIRGLVTTPGGKPVGGAQLDVFATPSVPGASAVEKTGLVTRANGRFTLRLEGGIGSRKIVVRYRPNLTSSAVGGQAAVDLTVRSAVRLKVRVARGAHGMPRFTFSGVLKGKPFPRPGQLVEVRVKKGRQWTVVGSPVRANANGKFRLRYQVSAPVRRGVRFTFRAQTRTNPAWAYRSGKSRTVRVRVR